MLCKRVFLVCFLVLSTFLSTGTIYAQTNEQKALEAKREQLEKEIGEQPVLFLCVP